MQLSTGGIFWPPGPAMYFNPVHPTCSPHLFYQPVHPTCSTHLFNPPVQPTCSPHLFNPPVQPTCSPHPFAPPYSRHLTPLNTVLAANIDAKFGYEAGEIFVTFLHNSSTCLHFKVHASACALRNFFGFVLKAG